MGGMIFGLGVDIMGGVFFLSFGNVKGKAM